MATTQTHPLGHVIGRSVPGGRYAIAPYESWIAHDAVYSAPTATPHPIMAFIGAQRGMGCTVAELFQLLESDIDDGPLLASTSIEIQQELVADAQYQVTGTVTDLVRKHGAALGDFDLATCVFTVSDETGRVVATVKNVYAIGRNK
jgi:hypothetical protein